MVQTRRYSQHHLLQAQDSVRLYEGGLLNSTFTEQGEFPNTRETAQGPRFALPSGAANLTPLLSSIFTLILREHNRKARLILRESPSLSDEDIFQRAKTWTIAVIQRITYEQVSIS